MDQSSILDDTAAIWEGVAADALEATGCDDAYVDAFELADCCGLRVVRAYAARARLHGRTVYVDTTARIVRQHGLVAHEVGHFLLLRAREDNTERGANYLSGALMLPRRRFDRDLGTTWNPLELQQKHPYASCEMIARRIVALRDAVATIWDHGRLTRRIASPRVNGLTGRRPTPVEQMVADRVYDTGAAVYLDDLVFGIPIFDGRWRRVIVIAEAEQLELCLRRLRHG